MDFPSDIFSLFLFTIAFLVVYSVLLNIYFIHKSGFHITVNCWFCNRNSKVLYSDRNSFECPFCFQYNGFNKDGGYNKVITAQHNSSANLKFNTPDKSSTPKPYSNGLCELCNRNQELKVLQLASYEPLVEENYDKEIKHFEQQLEKCYGLCKRCSKTVKRTIRKQNAWIFGNKLKNFKYPKVLSQLQWKLNISSLILLLLSLVSLGIFCGLDFLKVKALIPQYTISNLTLPINIYKSIYNYSKSTLGPKSFLRYLPRTLSAQASAQLLVSFTGLIIELLFNLKLMKTNTFSKLSHVTAWLILTLVSLTRYNSDVALYFHTLHLFCASFLSYSYGSMVVESHIKRSTKFHFKRLHKTANSFSNNDESDSDDPNVSRLSYKTAVYNKDFPLKGSFTQFNNTVKNADINRHFSDLNIDALNGTKSHCNSPINNPFLSPSAKSQFSYSPCSISPRFIRTEPVFTQDNINQMPFMTTNLNRSNLFSPRDTFIQNTQNFNQFPKEETMSNHSFRPASPTRNFVSPSKFNLSPENVSNVWPQRFTVNSVQLGSGLANPISQYQSSLGSGLRNETVVLSPANNSRSSSTSSGFVSNGDFVKYLSTSLPNSRDNSPERNSLLSEPVYR
ncbi:uncharacterized protein [Euwallacea similis]|uniref:uncharacterized protein n=1 Tax=Euwallacea similis TaxID=1736056 RepID=UPI00344B9995